MCTAGFECIDLESNSALAPTCAPQQDYFSTVDTPLNLVSSLSSPTDDYAPPSTNWITFGDEERVFASSVPLPPDPSHDTQESTSSSPVRTPSPTHPLGVTPL